LLQVFLDMLYPVRCPVCDEIVMPKGERICSLCKSKLKYISEPRCKKCSKPIEVEEEEYCSDCLRKEYQFIKGFALWIYDEHMKKSISDFKYYNKKENAKFYIQEIIGRYGKTIEKISPDVLVPVPIHKSKHGERGYNQADILAKGLGKELGLPVLSHLLIRNKKTLPQKQLSDKERLRNLRKAFEFNHEIYQRYGKEINKVLLVDDIYTTGSTIEACSNVLINQKIKEVYFVTLCIGKGF
jgi:ComF family protein